MEVSVCRRAKRRRSFCVDLSDIPCYTGNPGVIHGVRDWQGGAEKSGQDVPGAGAERNRLAYTRQGSNDRRVPPDDVLYNSCRLDGKVLCFNCSRRFVRPGRFGDIPEVQSDAFRRSYDDTLYGYSNCGGGVGVLHWTKKRA